MTKKPGHETGAVPQAQARPQPGANPDGEPDTQPAAPAQPASSAHPSGSPSLRVLPSLRLPMPRPNRSRLRPPAPASPTEVDASEGLRRCSPTNRMGPARARVRPAADTSPLMGSKSIPEWGISALESAMKREFHPVDRKQVSSGGEDAAYTTPRRSGSAAVSIC